MSDLGRMLDGLRFWEQIEGDAKRTLFCTPEDEQRVQDAVDAADAGHIFTVCVSPACPLGQILVVDEPALEAAWHQTMQRMLKDWRFLA